MSAFARLEGLTKGLFEDTMTDWTLSISWIMTEPGDAMARLKPNNPNAPQLDNGGVFHDNMESLIHLLCDTIENNMKKPEFIEFSEKAREKLKEIRDGDGSNTW